MVMYRCGNCNWRYCKEMAYDPHCHDEFWVDEDGKEHYLHDQQPPCPKCSADPAANYKEADNR